MKILWFTNTSSLYDQGKHHYHGCGWIESLEELVRNKSEIELAIAFFHPNDNYKVNNHRSIYYPIKRARERKKPFRAVLKNWHGKIENEDYRTDFIQIIEDFKPDVIHIFGTEGSFAQIPEITSIPVIVHLQGLLNPIVNTYFPIGYSKFDFIFNCKYLLKNIIGSSPIFSHKRFKAQAKREKKIFSELKHVCGRTEWDRQITLLFNPAIKYYHIDEVLRPVFYKQHDLKQLNEHKKFTILSTISPTIYKGIDVILKTAKLLTELTEFEFEWKVIGLEESADLLKLFEQKEKISHHSVNIKLLGKVDSNRIVNEMLNADVFIHPSYIDNSPNSICEAQMLGLPVIACNVGGVSSLITNDVSGYLVPSNGIYEIVSHILSLKNNFDLRKRIGEKAQLKAKERHDRIDILNKLISVYSEIK